ncbi:TPA: hypothetical protein JG904_001546 [Enterobacter hormaechei subsp. xiangfangensis]|nr:hypothetical protein [Enterobacter hormaechei subsp. xiangfangensis]
MMALTTNQLKQKNLYFYFYMAAPAVFPITFYFTMHEKAAYAALYAVLLICVVFDQRALVRSGAESETHIVGSALGIVILPPIYVYARARDTGMKKWRWLLAFIAITLGCIFISTTIDDNEALKRSACEITTSIFKDKNSDVQCLAIEDVKKVSDKHYRAKAVLSNGVDMPITIEERGDDYIYVTLVPLSGLLD